MAQSGSRDFSLNRDEIIKGALRLIYGIGGRMNQPSKTGGNETSQASEALNIMIKSWQARNIGIWTNKEIALFPAYETRSYLIGPSGTNASMTWVKTETSADASATDLTIDVDSITGISASDNIGIELDDNTLQWTTVDGAPAVLTITLAAALTDDVTTNNNIYTYTTKTPRPLLISEARLFRDDSTESPLTILTRNEYMNFANKTTTGYPSQIYYDPQLTNGVLYVWPIPATVDFYIKFTARIPLQDFDAATDDPDFPIEWIRAIKYNLAVELLPEYDLPGKDNVSINSALARANMLEQKAMMYLNEVTGSDAENTSVYFVAEGDYYN